MRKENIKYESYIKEFDFNLEKNISLKDKIEKEIIKINDLYEKINKELKQIYKEKYKSINDAYNKKLEELKEEYEEKYKKIKEESEYESEIIIKEENNLKETLEKRITETKEKLEKFLLRTSNIIKINEQINKGIKNNKEEKNIIKKLYYISIINKNIKEMESLPNELIENLDICFKENKLIFHEYYFNGFPYPKDIKFNYDDILNIQWDIDNNNLENIDKKKNKV